jgi:hypothetical protein
VGRAEGVSPRARLGATPEADERVDGDHLALGRELAGSEAAAARVRRRQRPRRIARNRGARRFDERRL